ncbi:MAG: hypothetical protein ACI4AB_05480 [Acetatifactor sp.]
MEKRNAREYGFQDFQLLHAPGGENIAAGIEVDRERVVDCLEISRVEKLI